MEDIEKYNNNTVKIIGIYSYQDASKCWIAFIILEDNTSVVYQYQPSEINVTKYNNNKVEITGIILESYPITHQPLQWIRAPHIVDVKEIKIL